MLEVVGLIATVMAILGVVLNNRRLRACFLLWLLSNSMTALIHAQAAIWSLFARDVVFLLLAVEGWYRWKEKA